MHRPAIALFFLILLSTGLSASEAKQDSDGEPLPEGAVARFGSARLLHGHVEHLDLSPDGKTLASSGHLGVRLWDTTTGRVISVAHLPQWRPAVFVFTPDGSHLVGDEDGCRLIDPRTGKVRRAWRNGSRTPRLIAVSADGKTAAVAWKQGGITVHDLAGGKPTDWKLTDEVPRDWFGYLALSGDGKRLAYNKGPDDATSLLLWDTRRGKLLDTYQMPKERLSSLCLNRDGRKLAVSWGTKVHLWDTQAHAPVKEFTPPEADAVFLRFSADETELMGVSGWQGFGRWSASTGKELAYRQSSKKETSPFWGSILSPDGRIVAGTNSAALRLWDTASWKDRVAIERWPSWYESVFIQPDLVATHTRGSTEQDVIAFWKLESGRLVKKRTTVLPDRDGWWRRGLSPDGKLFAGVAEKRGVVLFDVESGKELRHFPSSRREDGGAQFAFAPDSKTIVTNSDRQLTIWDAATGERRRDLDGVWGGALAFSPDGRTVASAWIRNFDLTEVASGKQRFHRSLPFDENHTQGEDIVCRIRFSRDNRRVVAVSQDNLQVFATISGKLLLHLTPQTPTRWGDECAVALSPDGRWLAHGDSDHDAVCIRDLNNPHAAVDCQTLFGHAGHVTGLTFSPDGKHLVSCSADGTALVWDTKILTGKPAPPRKPLPPAAEIGPLSSPGAEAYWEGLADADAGRALKAMAALIELPDETVAMLKARLKPISRPAAAQIDRWIAELDSDEFEVRQKAFQDLQPFAEEAVPTLRKALEGRRSAEFVRQARQLLKAGQDPASNGQRLRQVRAVEVLERIGTSAAREVLQALAKGPSSAWLTQEARSALQRWRMPGS